MASILTGKDLVADIEQCVPPAGQLALWWLGQDGFVLKSASGVIYVDAFLSDIPGRLVPPLLSPQQLSNAALVCGTHDHADHIDRGAWPVVAKAAPQARFVVPELLRERLSRELDIDTARLIGVDDGQTIELAGVKIHGVASAHELLDQDPATGKFPHMGYVIEAGGMSVYHSGDCCVYECLVTKLRKLKPQVMLLPINGRDAKRLKADIIGNMTYQEAVDLAGAVGAKLAIPAHYDMFAMNLGSPGDFCDYMAAKYPHVKTHICRYGERLIVGPF